jgi:NagD protein
MLDLARIRHFVLDLDGTLYRGGRLFDCTLPFLATLERLGLGRTFLTNNTALSKSDYVEKLNRLGIPASESDIYTPADSAILYLRANVPAGARLAVLGTPSLCRQFEEAGFVVDWEAPQAVVAGFDMTLTYERLCRAAWWISKDLPFIATHPDFVCPTSEPTVLVDCGSICAALTAATGRRPVTLGKPDPSILWDLCRREGLDPAQAAMVGDRLYTDIAMAQKAGAAAILVLSGEARADQAAALDPPPDLVVADVGELARFLGGLFRAGLYPGSESGDKVTTG